MAKYLKLFNNHQEFDNFTKTCRYIKPNVSVCESNMHVHYDEWHVGDILHTDGSVAPCPINGKTPVGILVIPASHTDDNTYRFMSLEWWSPANGSDFDLVERRLYPGLKKYHSSPIIDENGEISGWASTTFSYASKAEPPQGSQGYNYELVAGSWYNTMSNGKYAPAPFLEDGSKNPLYSAESPDVNNLNPLSDMDGYEHTQYLYEFDGENLPPVKFCKEYAPGFHDGEWYLPTIGEWGYFYYNKYGILLEQMRKALKAIGKNYYGIAEIWSSTQCGTYTMLMFYHANANGRYGNQNKTQDHNCTIPFLKIKKDE